MRRDLGTSGPAVTPVSTRACTEDAPFCALGLPRSVLNNIDAVSVTRKFLYHEDQEPSNLGSDTVYTLRSRTRTIHPGQDHAQTWGRTPTEGAIWEGDLPASEEGCPEGASRR